MSDDRHDEPVVSVEGSADEAELRRELLRLAAEFDNYRKAVARERELLRERALDEAALALLPVYDALGRALAARGDGDPLREDLLRLQGLVEEALARLGCQAYSSLGKPFDPLYHEALWAEEAESEKNTILAEYERGFVRQGRVLRPAKVKVSLGRPGGGVS